MNPFPDSMYNRLFTKILDSSIWLESKETRIVWFTLLAAMDEDGYAHFSAIENLANRARVTKEEAEEAVRVLMAPDPNSANPDFEGRRVERVPGGFLVLNAKNHRGVLNREAQREQVRLRVRRFREKKSGALPPSPPSGNSEAEEEAEVTPGNGRVTLELALQTEDGTAKWNIPPQLDREPFTSTWARWVSFRKTMKRVKDWETMFEAQLKRLSGLTPEVAAETLEKSISNGWQGLFPPDGTQPGANGSLPAWKVRQDQEHQIVALEDKARWMQDGPARAKLVAEIQELKRKVGA